jgi:quinoprotein glucose dehydrogenase
MNTTFPYLCDIGSSLHTLPRAFWVGLVTAVILPSSLASADDGGDWQHFGSDLGGSQYSPLNQIDRSNVAELEPVWTHRSGDYKDGKTSLQVTPIHANGMLYYCTPMNRVFALDPATGEERWVFDPHTGSGDDAPVFEAERVPLTCRGVAYWADEETDKHDDTCAKRVFKNDFFGHLYAIDADTGEACEDFGAANSHPGYVSHFDHESYGEGIRFMSSPPLVVGDLVISGSGSNDGLSNAADGIVRAFDVRTGSLQWEFNPIPDDMRNVTGAANVWSTMSADPANGLVFFPTTSPSTDYYGGGRKFDIPLSDAVIAANVETGELVWSFQTVRHDIFDYDLPGHPLLVDIKKDGERRSVAIQQTKMGFLFVFDRLTGEPVFPISEMNAPKTDVTGEISAATQPVSNSIATFAQQTLDRESLFGITPVGRSWCQKQFDTMRYDGLYTPPSEQGSLLYPSALGGGNWGGAAFHPESNLLIIKASNLATRLKLVPKPEGDDEQESVDYLTRPLKGTPYNIEGEVFVAPSGVPCTPPPWGTLTAIDMDSGKQQWQVPLGQVKRFGIKALEAWGSPNIGGPIVTAGDLIFVAAALDESIRALDINTGEKLWQSDLPVSGTAVPMTYMGSDGRQFVVIAAGGTDRAETGAYDAIKAYALPKALLSAGHE